MTLRSSIARLADDAPVPHPDYDFAHLISQHTVDVKFYRGPLGCAPYARRNGDALRKPRWFTAGKVFP